MLHSAGLGSLIDTETSDSPGATVIERVALPSARLSGPRAVARSVTLLALDAAFRSEIRSWTTRTGIAQFAPDPLSTHAQRAARREPHVADDAAVRPPVVPGLGLAARAEARDRGGAGPIVDRDGQEIDRAQMRVMSKEYAVKPPSCFPISTPFNQTRAE